MKKRIPVLISVIILLIVTFSWVTNKNPAEKNNKWVSVEYTENYFEDVLSKYNEGHFPWRNDRYEVSKEFLVSDKIESRVFGDVSLKEKKTDSYVFETEDNKQIEVHTIKPFSDAKIYFVDKYRFIKQ